MTKKILALISIAAMLCIACGASQANVTAQATARNSIKLVNDAWTAAAQVCLATPSATPTCGPVLYKAYQVILTAANAVDTWTSASQSQYACAVNSAIYTINGVFSSLNTPMPQVMLDAVMLAQSLAGNCPDGGV